MWGILGLLLCIIATSSNTNTSTSTRISSTVIASEAWRSMDQRIAGLRVMMVIRARVDA